MLDRIKDWWANLTDTQRKLVIGAIVTLVLAVLSAVFGIPLLDDLWNPPLDKLDEPVELGTTHFTNISVEDAAVTDDLTVTDDATIGGDMTVSGTASWGCSDTTISNDLTLTGTLRAQDGVITGTIDVDGNTDLDDVQVSGEFEVTSTSIMTGAVTMGSTLGVGGNISLENSETIGNATDGLISLGGGIIYNSEWITPTAMDGGEHFTPTTTSLYIVGSTGAVSMTLAACSSTGQALFTYGDAANNVTINDTNVRTNDGSAQVMGQYDLITWMCIGTTWVEIGESNNS